MTQPFRVQQIDHVEMFVPDRFAAAAWYERVLGLEIVDAYRHWADNPQGPLMISPDSGSTKLAVFTGTPRGNRETAGFHLVAFRVDASGFLAFLKRIGSGEIGLLDDGGVPVTHNDAVDHRQAWSIYFCDPWGHRIEVTCYEYEEVAMSLGRLIT